MLWAVLAIGLALAIASLAAYFLLGALGGRAGAGGGTPQAGPARASGARSATAPLPVTEADPSPEFRLLEKSGRTVTDEDLAGKVWVANFIFTKCPTVCPALTRTMAAVRAGLDAGGGGDILTVSFSVDPEHDTPEVLARYAREQGAEDDSWLFLTGSNAEMLRVVRDGFHLMMADPAKGEPIHSDRFVVVDDRGRVRARVSGEGREFVDSLVREALASRAPAPA